MPARQCTATKVNGDRCTSYAVEGSALCFTHDPTRAAERHKARTMGGHARRTAHTEAVQPEQVRTIDDVYALLDYALAETAALENSIIRSRALIALAETYLKTINGNEIDARLARLEETVQQRTGR